MSNRFNLIGVVDENGAWKKDHLAALEKVGFAQHSERGGTIVFSDIADQSRAALIQALREVGVNIVREEQVIPKDAAGPIEEFHSKYRTHI